MSKKKKRNKLVLTNPDDSNDKVRMIYDSNGFRIEKVTITEVVTTPETIDFNQNFN